MVFIRYIGFEFVFVFELMFMIDIPMFSVRCKCKNPIGSPLGFLFAC